MSEIDDAVQAIDDLKGRLDGVANLGDIAAQIEDAKRKLEAVGNLGDTAQKLNQVLEKLKLGDKYKEIYEKLNQLQIERFQETLSACLTTIVTLVEALHAVIEFKDIVDTMKGINDEIGKGTEEAQATYQAMQDLGASLQATSQLGDLAPQLTDLKGKLDAIANLGDLATRMSDLKSKLDAAEEKLKAASA